MSGDSNSSRPARASRPACAGSRSWPKRGPSSTARSRSRGTRRERCSRGRRRMSSGWRSMSQLPLRSSSTDPSSRSRACLRPAGFISSAATKDGRSRPVRRGRSRRALTAPAASRTLSVTASSSFTARAATPPRTPALSARPGSTRRRSGSAATRGSRSSPTRPSTPPSTRTGALSSTGTPTRTPPGRSSSRARQSRSGTGGPGRGTRGTTARTTPLISSGRAPGATSLRWASSPGRGKRAGWPRRPASTSSAAPDTPTSCCTRPRPFAPAPTASGPSAGSATTGARARRYRLE